MPDIELNRLFGRLGHAGQAVPKHHKRRLRKQRG
jgi:hypothetical protein